MTCINSNPGCFLCYWNFHHCPSLSLLNILSSTRCLAIRLESIGKHENTCDNRHFQVELLRNGANRALDIQLAQWISIGDQCILSMETEETQRRKEMRYVMQFRPLLQSKRLCEKMLRKRMKFLAFVFWALCIKRNRV